MRQHSLAEEGFEKPTMLAQLASLTHLLEFAYELNSGHLFDVESGAE